MTKIEQTLDSKEVAEMMKKDHAMLLRDLRRYEKQFNDCNLAVVEFFQESTYKDAKGETRPCYRITKKGCEFIAHKLTGTKGTIFTARYINRFHEMQDTITEQAAGQEPELPRFITMVKCMDRKNEIIKLISEVDVEKEGRFLLQILTMIRTHLRI